MGYSDLQILFHKSNNVANPIHFQFQTGSGFQVGQQHFTVLVPHDSGTRGGIPVFTSIPFMFRPEAGCPPSMGKGLPPRENRQYPGRNRPHPQHGTKSGAALSPGKTGPGMVPDSPAVMDPSGYPPSLVTIQSIMQ